MLEDAMPAEVREMVAVDELVQSGVVPVR